MVTLAIKEALRADIVKAIEAAAAKGIKHYQAIDAAEDIICRLYAEEEPG